MGVETAASARRALTAAEVAATVQLACLLEASAPKPGNVSPGRHFADTRYEDFLASAAAVGGPLAGVGTRPIGATIRRAIEATARWTRTNTNLGLVLLLTPLARAGLDRGERVGLRDALRGVLDATTVDDARDVYAAIRMAAPGGLGRVDDQDVADDPEVTLVEAMRLAADRDGIAREYATAFGTTFETGAPALARARRDGLSWDEAIVEAFLSLLAAAPDTHLARRAGAGRAEAVRQQARRVLAAGGVRSRAGRQAIDEMDRGLRDARNLSNPGATADLTAAAIFVLLMGEDGLDRSDRSDRSGRSGRSRSNRSYELNDEHGNDANETARAERPERERPERERPERERPERERPERERPEPSERSERPERS